MAHDGGRLLRWSAAATGVVGLISLISLALFYAIEGPFGAINDWSIGAGGVLTAVLIVAIRRSRASAWAGLALVIEWAALIGAAIVVIGSFLVISRSTGFFLAGLVESLGFALIGLWLIVLVRSRDATRSWPGNLNRLGLIAGLLMALGFVVAPGIAMGIDDVNNVPAWIWIGEMGWLGIFFLYPIWSIWLGRVEREGQGAGGRA